MSIWRFVGWSCETPRTASIAVCRSTVSWSRCSQGSLRRRQNKARSSTDRGNPYKNRNREGGGQCRSAWTSACRRAGIVDLHHHDLRHTFATWGLIAGMSDRVKKEIMGHSSSEMSDRYAHVLLHEAIAAIDLILSRWYEEESQQAWRSRCQPKTTRPWKDPVPLPILAPFGSNQGRP